MNGILIVDRNFEKINKLKRELSNSFDMKNLEPVRQILDMKISYDKKNDNFWLSQESYIEKVLNMFNKGKAKPLSSPLGHLNLSSKQSPTNKKEKEEIQNVPYALVIGSLMYVMVYTRLDTTHVVISLFLSNLGKEHWVVMKWILRYLRGTSKACLCFENSKAMLDGFIDLDMAGDIDS